MKILLKFCIIIIFVLQFVSCANSQLVTSRTYAYYTIANSSSPVGGTGDLEIGKDGKEKSMEKIYSQSGDSSIIIYCILPSENVSFLSAIQAGNKMHISANEIKDSVFIAGYSNDGNQITFESEKGKKLWQLRLNNVDINKNISVAPIVLKIKKNGVPLTITTNSLQELRTIPAM